MNSDTSVLQAALEKHLSPSALRKAKIRYFLAGQLPTKLAAKVCPAHRFTNKRSQWTQGPDAPIWYHKGDEQCVYCGVSYRDSFKRRHELFRSRLSRFFLKLARSV